MLDTQTAKRDENLEMTEERGKWGALDVEAKAPSVTRLTTEAVPRREQLSYVFATLSATELTC